MRRDRAHAPSAHAGRRQRGTPAAIIVDNGGSGYTDSGNWVVSSATPGYWGNNYQHDGSSGASTQWAALQPNVSTTGTYNVYLLWPAHANRPDAVPLRVHYGGGTSQDTSKQVNQQINGGQWVLIGAYQFVAGSTDRLVVLGGDAGYTIADAAKFELA